jgi:hypothetical protein
VFDDAKGGGRERQRSDRHVTGSYMAWYRGALTHSDTAESHSHGAGHSTARGARTLWGGGPYMNQRMTVETTPQSISTHEQHGEAR